MMNFICVFLGGGTGAVLRYLVSEGWKHWQGPTLAFPWPTFIVNVLGSLLIGLFYTHSQAWGLSPSTRLLLTTGLCGGFTTFSTFSYETFSLLRGGMYGTCALYVGLSLVLGLLVVAWVSK